MGSERLRVLHGTGRCPIPNVNSDDGTRTQEPYATLKSFRPAPYGYGKHGGPEFGLWISGPTYASGFRISVGDVVVGTDGERQRLLDTLHRKYSDAQCGGRMPRAAQTMMNQLEEDIAALREHGAGSGGGDE